MSSLHSQPVVRRRDCECSSAARAAALLRRCSLATGCLLVACAVAPQLALAHGIVGKADLPIPVWLFSWAAAIVLVVSFVALSTSWTKPQLQRPRLRRAFRLPVQFEPLLSLIGLALFGLILYSGFAGAQVANANFSVTFIYVVFWVGMPGSSSSTYCLTATGLNAGRAFAGLFPCHGERHAAVRSGGVGVPRRRVRRLLQPDLAVIGSGVPTGLCLSASALERDHRSSATAGHRSADMHDHRHYNIRRVQQWWDMAQQRAQRAEPLCRPGSQPDPSDSSWPTPLASSSASS